MGDTCSGEMIAPLAANADVVVHEATNAWFREQDSVRHPTEGHLERDTFSHGHSTPQMAGKFCKQVGARKLVLTHFSPRYRGDDSDYSMKTMWRFEHFARKASGLWGRNDVIAAWDQMALPVRNKEDEDKIRDWEAAAADKAHAASGRPGNHTPIIAIAAAGQASDAPEAAEEVEDDEEDFIVPPTENAEADIFAGPGSIISM